MNPNEFGIGAWVPASYGHSPKEAQVMDDEWWMMAALQEAQTFTGGASPNPTVGCVFVKDKVIIARGVTEAFGGRHGEKVAADSVAEGSLRGSTAYVTLEPCSHQGKQAPCAPMLVKQGISRCVIGIQDPFDKVDGGGIKTLQDAGIEVQLGILADACRAWHLDFLFHCAYKRPMILAKWAQSLDGQLADDDSQSKWITGAEARAYTHLLRQKCDGIMVGAGTVLADKPSLDVRDCKTRIHRSPVKIVIDYQGDLLKISQRDQEQLQAKTLAHGVTIYCGPSIEGSFLDKCSTVHHLLLESRLQNSDLERIFQLFESIKGQSLLSVMVEGGASLLNSMLEADLIDAAVIFQRPALIGGQMHRIGQVRGKNRGRSLTDKLDFHLMMAQSIGQDIVMECLNPKHAHLLRG